MSNISFDYPIKRVAIVKTPSMPKPVIIGEVEEFDRNQERIHVNVRLADDIPEKMKIAIEKNPQCIEVMETLAPPINFLIIPSRPKLVL